jgi:hypothetical protein
MNQVWHLSRTAIMPRRLRARVHDVAQSLARIGVVLIGRKASPILASRLLKIVLGAVCWICRIANALEKTPRRAQRISRRTGLLLSGSARNDCACHDHRGYHYAPQVSCSTGVVPCPISWADTPPWSATTIRPVPHRCVAWKQRSGIPYEANQRLRVG